MIALLVRVTRAHPRTRDATAVALLFALVLGLSVSVAAPAAPSGAGQVGAPSPEYWQPQVAEALAEAVRSAAVPATLEPPATPPATPPLEQPPPAAGKAGPAGAKAAPSTTTTTTTTTTLPPDPLSMLPSGKGMWIWQPESADGGDPAAIVSRALASGISHIFVRTGSSRSGFHGGPFLEVVLPAAHDAGLRVYGWDFPYLEDVGDDVARAMTAITYDVGGHRIDGFVPDIETVREGTNLTVEGAHAYAHGLRDAAGVAYPLIVAVPRPSESTRAFYPYAQVIEPFDAVAPMVYWLNRQPDTDVAGAVDWLTQFGKPVLPIGQAYDGAAEGGRPGVPPADEIHRFIDTAAAHGAHSVSFWSWQHANQAVWDAIRDNPAFPAG